MQVAHRPIHEGRVRDVVTAASYSITEEPLPDHSFERLPGDVQTLINTLHDKVLGARPKQEVFDALISLTEQYPDIPHLYNYLYIAYFRMGKRGDASRVVQQTMQRFPDYLFGRLSLAEECLARGEPEKVAEIFGGKFDLKLQYPERALFHVSEVISFQCVVARYHHALGNREQAQQAYDLMRQLNPKHPSTRLVRSVLHPSRFWVWLRDKIRLFHMRRQQ